MPLWRTDILRLIFLYLGVTSQSVSPFTYEPEQDQYRCNHRSILRNHGFKMAAGYGNYHYIANFSTCQNCPIKESCCGNQDRKSLSVTMYYREYERMEARLRSAKGKRLKRRRSAVVEPVFGSLLNYFGMPHRRIGRTPGKGKAGAHKRMVMAAMAYNLKKRLLAKRWPKVVAHVLALYPEGPFFCLYCKDYFKSSLIQKSCSTVTRKELTLKLGSISGLSSLLTPGQTKGIVSVSATLVGSSGGEVTMTNNTDADQLEYFNK